MTPPLPAPVAVVGARDRDLEALLAAGGIRAVTLPASDLPTLAHPASRPPAVLVIDLRDSGQFPAVLPELKRHHPRVAVVLVASTLAPALMLEAMRAGVSECVAEPLAGPELVAAVRRLHAAHQPQVAGKVFAVMGAKGGVGATTVAVNLATELAKVAPGRTLLVDLDVSHGDAAVMLGAEPRFTVLDALENTHRLDESVFRGLVTSTRAGVALLAAGQGWPTQPVAPEAMRKLLDAAAHLYEYVVVDLPRSGAGAVEALDTTTRVIVVANQELSTVRRARQLIAALQARWSAERVSVVVSRFDPDSEIRREDVEQVVKLPIRHTVPSDYRLALRAQNLGRPLTLDTPNRLASAFRDLTRDLAGLPPSEPSTTIGFFGRLSGRRSPSEVTQR